MRISARNQICEVLATLYDGVVYSASAHENDALPVLEDCSEAVSALRESFGVHLSEERAMFYDKHAEGVSDGIIKMTGGIRAKADISQCAEEALESLRIIYTEFITESEAKLEVAFFPYKASMWDSLESIWAAARNDERCNTTVVPIRYFEKSPNGTVLKEICERDLFPDYVPIIRHEDYNPETEAPDIVYIHNPYDKNNFVTSVDPAYYSGEIKKYASALVYVPYYVSGGASSDTFASVACATAADMIFVSSQREADRFKEYSTEKDIQPLGSPKVDRILLYKSEKPEMPSQWRDKLDGKKVFLLNTSVSSLLRHGKNFCDKLNGIFDIFAAREDIALLWRPHPLTNATINSMRPALRDGFEKLTQRISDIGVLDETADVTRAIALADVYIGEGSTSLVFMYALTGKPLYILDFDIPKNLTGEQRDEILKSACIAYITPEDGGETALAVSYDTDEICRIELETGRVTTVADIPEIQEGVMHPYQYIADCGDKYILHPVYSDKFIELDREFKLIRTEELPEAAKADIVFAAPVRHGGYVYFLPSRSKAIGRYCISTGEYEYYYDWHKDFEKYAEGDDPGIFSGFYCVAGNKIYLPCYKDNVVAELNMETMKVKAYRLGPKGCRYYSITHDGKYFWLTMQRPPGLSAQEWSGSIIRWNPKTGKAEGFSDFPKKFESGSVAFRKIVYYGSKLLVFPNTANMILEIDKKTGKMTEFCPGIIETEEDKFLPDPKSAVFNHSVCSGGSVYAIMGKERALLTIDTKTGAAKKTELHFDKPHKEEKRTANMWFMTPKHDKTNRGIFHERQMFPFEEFYRRVLSGAINPISGEQAEFYLNRVENPDGTAGAKIHEYVMGKIFDDGEE